MPLYDLSGAPAPDVADFVLDTRYSAPAQDDIAAFLQAGELALVFAVPVTPVPDSVNVQRAETATAHMIASYPNQSLVTLKMNDEVIPRVITTAIGGIFVSSDPAQTALTRDEDGFCHIRADGTEALAGPQFVEWQFTPVLPGASIALATASVSIAIAALGQAAGQIFVRTVSELLATGQLTIRPLGGVLTLASGRLLVGEVFVIFNAGGSVNIAEEFLTPQASGSYEIEGFAVFHRASGTFEIFGATLGDDAAGSYVIAKYSTTLDGAGTVELGTLTIHEDGSGTIDIWGGQGVIVSESTLIVRTSSLPAEVVEALAAAGVHFRFESPIAQVGVETIAEETLS
jgi:hypothetical protein